jgi:hypothetical protein
MLDGPFRVAQPHAEHAGQVAEQRNHRPTGLRLRLLERGHDLLSRRAVARRAQRGDQRGVQPPGGTLAQRLVVAGHREADHLPQQRAATLHARQQVPVLGDDPLDHCERLGVEDPAFCEPAPRPGKIAQQVVDVVLFVRPHPVHRAARHPRSMDDLFEAQVLDGERGTRLEGQVAAGVQHALPDLFRRHPLRPDRHGCLPPPSEFPLSAPSHIVLTDSIAILSFKKDC